VNDHELKNDMLRQRSGKRFITLNLNEDVLPETVAMELTGLFRLGSEMVQ